MKATARRAGLLCGLLVFGGIPALAGPSKRATKKKLKSIESKISSVEKERRRLATEKRKLAEKLRREKRKHRRVERLKKRYSKDERWSRIQRERFEKRSEALGEAREVWSRSLESEMRLYASALHSGVGGYTRDGVWKNVLLRRVIREKAGYLRTVHVAREKNLGFESRWAKKAERYASLKDTQEERSRRSADVVRRRNESFKAVSKKYRKLSSELARLRKSSEELAAMMASLSRPKTRRQSAYRAPDRKVRPGSMRWPAPGKVLERFGKVKVPELETWYVHEGVRIAARAGSPVRAAAPGRVIFSGPFRTYGKVVILDHGGDLFSIYGGLGRVEASVGKDFRKGETLGRAGKGKKTFRSAASGGDVYFEVRKGKRAVDPMRWLGKRK